MRAGVDPHRTGASPEARVGDGVKPGTYQVELALDGLVEHYQVDVR